MKVLWLTNNLTPDHAMALGQVPSPREGWIPALAQALVADRRIELAVATSVRDQNWSSISVNGVRYYSVPQPKGKIDAHRLPMSLIAGYQRVLDEFQPQVMHIHGTEQFHGLLTGKGHIRVPSVLSIQGIIDVCARHYLGGVPLTALLFKRTLRDWVRMDGLLEQQVAWWRRAEGEREVFATNSAFIGRTLWDQAHLRRMNPSARYFHCDEIIRKPFYRTKWDIQRAWRHQIFCSSASYPLKGFHVLLKAVALLKDEFPDISVHTPLARFYPEARGWRRLWMNCRKMGYARYLTDLIHAEKLERHVVPFPYLDAGGMVEELLQARVFVLPSFIENSPNSLAEAMLVGTPAVCAGVGGVPSMVRDGESALLFPPGDEAVLAEQIRRVFVDNDTAVKLSMQAHRMAEERHNVSRIVNTMVEIYQAMATVNSNEEPAFVRQAR
ncbi:glycosyltransferase family 4 protein [Desulforhabdus sp. TSK]|uniref:glycosyltransferase family 4 protein n=1 Tax=Desulforhabdus sp. TSK TaxID=2925014 RepID=UPI001FC8A4C5|nr:glycosyltransferase [Desulforhabdus sp. TSK]GKT08602.1 glycosyl transferase [Desulforhabdus sp. TSK]